MPTYQFVCRRGHVTEKRVGFECAGIPCPECKAFALRRAFYEDQYIQGETVSLPTADGRKLGFTKKEWDRADAMSKKARKEGTSA